MEGEGWEGNGKNVFPNKNNKKEKEDESCMSVRKKGKMNEENKSGWISL